MTEISKIYEDDGLIVINKPAGVLVHGDGKLEGDTVADWALSNYPSISSVGDDPENRPGIVHRLDKETSGILLIAKTQETYLYLKNLFKERNIKKKYLAVVIGGLKESEGTIDKEISIKGGSIKRTVHKGRLPKEAVTMYKVIENFNGYSLLEVSPKTGRTHQVRVHLASIHHPVIGDKVYGGKPARVKGIERHMLHAYSLKFKLQNGELVEFKAEPPEDFKSYIKTLKNEG